MLELYHGSDAMIDEIDLSRSKRGKVFGVTFIRILISLRRWRWRRVPPNVGLVIKLLSYVATNRRKGAL